MIEFKESNLDRSRAVMQDRGLLMPGLCVGETFRRLIKEICRIDADLGGDKTADFGARLGALIRDGVVVLGTPLLQNIGRGSLSAAACTVLRPLDDSQFAADSGLLRISAALLGDATGIGFDLSALARPDLSLTQLNAHLVEIDQTLRAANKRPVASMATLRDDHPQIVSFLRAKRDVDFADWRLNISMFASDAFFAAVDADAVWPLRDGDGRVVEMLPARNLLREVAASAHYCGDPGLLFRDRMERDNPTPQWSYVSTAPCAELAMAQGDACHFSYVNVGALVRDGVLDHALFEEAATCLVRMLDAATEVTVRGRGDALWLVAQKRRIGVGITGFADLLLRLRLPYDSHGAAAIAAELAEALEFYTKRASVALARDRGAFPAIAESRYRDRAWVGRKLEGKLLKIGRDRWDALIDDILRHGVRNASTTSMPPSGTSSEIVGASKSLEPYLSLRDREGALFEAFREFAPASCADEAQADCDEALLALPFVALAQDIEPLSHLAIQAGFQSFLDDGISKTVNLDRDCIIDDVFELLRDAYRYGVKGVAVFRDDCLIERAGTGPQ